MADATKWTEGPWFAGTVQTDDYGSEYFTVGPHEPHPASGGTHYEDTIAQVFSGNHDGEANAALIVAAPDLYEALDDVMRELGRTGWELPVHDRARSALAKARGEPTPPAGTP